MDLLLMVEEEAEAVALVVVDTVAVMDDTRRDTVRDIRAVVLMVVDLTALVLRMDSTVLKVVLTEVLTLLIILQRLTLLVLQVVAHMGALVAHNPGAVDIRTLVVLVDVDSLLLGDAEISLQGDVSGVIPLSLRVLLVVALVLLFRISTRNSTWPKLKSSRIPT